MRSTPTTVFKFILIISCLFSAINACAFSTDTTIVKGSYLFYAPLTIEDNSLFIDEALNQGPGSLQFVSTLLIEQNSIEYQFETEIPLAGEKHQLSFTIPVTLRSFRIPPLPGNKFFKKVGDFQISYRPLLLGKDKWCLLAPSFTLILPGDFDLLSANGCGGEIKIAATKRIERNVTTHLNFGGAWIAKRTANGDPDFNANVSIQSKQSASVGAGLVWAVTRSFNLMLEQVYTGSIDRVSSLSKPYDEMTISPAMRFALNIGKHQLVPAIGFPMNFSGMAFQGCSPLIYLSFETGN